MKKNTLFILTFLTIPSLLADDVPTETALEEAALAEPQSEEAQQVAPHIQRFAEATERSAQYQGPIGKDLHELFTAAAQGATPQELERIYHKSELDGLPEKVIPTEFTIDENPEITTSAQKMAHYQNLAMSILQFIKKDSTEEKIKRILSIKKRKLDILNRHYTSLNNGSISAAIKRKFGYGDIAEVELARNRAEADYLRIKAAYDSQRELLEGLSKQISRLNRELFTPIAQHPLCETGKRETDLLKEIIASFPVPEEPNTEN